MKSMVKTLHVVVRYSLQHLAVPDNNMVLRITISTSNCQGLRQEELVLLREIHSNDDDCAPPQFHGIGRTLLILRDSVPSIPCVVGGFPLCLEYIRRYLLRSYLILGTAYCTLMRCFAAREKSEYDVDGVFDPGGTDRMRTRAAISRAAQSREDQHGGAPKRF